MTDQVSPLTTAQVLAIQPDQYGWRKLPDGREVKIAANAIIADSAWASVGAWARVGAWASVGDGARVGARARVGDGANIPTSKDLMTIDFAGSRLDTLSAQLNVYPIIISTGCFRQKTIDEFEQAVTKSHGNNQWAAEYRAIVAMLRAVQYVRFPELIPAKVANVKPTKKTAAKVSGTAKKVLA